MNAANYYRKSTRLDTTGWARWPTGNCVRNWNLTIRTNGIQESSNKFTDFFVRALLLIVHTWNSCPLRSNLLGIQCTCCTVLTTSGRLHGSPLCVSVSMIFVRASLISSIVSYRHPLNNQKSQAGRVWTIERVKNCLDAHLGQIVCDKDGIVDWCIVLLEMPLTRFEECWPLPKESLPELP